MGVKIERLKREYKIQYGDFKIKYGTYNKNNPKSIYIEIGFWVKYNGDLKSYNERVQHVTSSMRSAIKKRLNSTSLLSDSFIFILTAKKSVSNKDKAFFACANITISQTENINTDICSFEDIVMGIGKEIITIVDGSSYFDISTPI